MLVRKKVWITVLLAIGLHIGFTGLVYGDAPTPGGHLKIAFLSAIQDNMDLCKATAVFTKMIVANALDTLIAKDPTTGKYYPGLAQAWEISPDNRSVTLYLRKDVTFHDGTPFNAYAVKANFDHIANTPDCSGKEAYSKLGVDTVLEGYEVIDEYTFKITYKKPYARMLENLADPFVGGMHSPAAFEKYGDDYGVKALVGTGPFKFVEWTGGPQGQVVFERNDAYNWAPAFYDHQGPAYLDGFTVLGVLDSTTRAALIETGQVDMAYVEPVDFVRLREIPGLKGWLQSRKGWGDLSVNFENPILRDLRVRQAIAHAIDKEAINNSPVFMGLGEIKYCEFTEALWGSNPSPKEEFGKYNLPYDPDRARELLEKAGWKDTDGDGIREAHGVEGVEDGTRLHLVDPVRDYEKAYHEIIQAMLADVGIELEVQVYDFSTREKLLFEGKFDVAPWPTTAQSFFAFYEEMHSKSVPFYNIGHYSNSVVDCLLDAAMSITDPDLQREYFRLVAIQILKDLASIPTVKPRNCWILKDRVEGVKSDLMSVGFDLYDAWIVQ
ncbi:MAG: hypothetical protein JRI56_08400 [Deltaproteobacteria bacterium]|nr:hypothetical protein [Deltaproteobacteria bacterium]